MKKNTRLKQFYQQYKWLIIYGLVGINIFGMIIAVRVYINFHTIQSSITKVQAESEYLRLQDKYSKTFLEKYLQSEHASYFLAHENNRILPGEKMIRLLDKSKPGSSNNNSDTSNQAGIPIESLTPQQARNKFLWERRQANEF